MRRMNLVTAIREIGSIRLDHDRTNQFTGRRRLTGSG